MVEEQRSVRIALPSKGLLAEDSKDLLAQVGFGVHSPNPRQYRAQIPSLPGVEVIFQRPGDIVVSVRDGSVDFGITGRDVYLDKRGTDDSILELRSSLDFGACSLNVIVPESWTHIHLLQDLWAFHVEVGRPVRVATKFPNLTRDFFAALDDLPIEIILAEGALEIAPTVGYADIIVDLVSTGTTLRDNRLRILAGGLILQSHACLIANRSRLQSCDRTLAIATQMLESIGAHLRAQENLAVFANVRGRSPEDVADLIFQKETIGGLQGPTISRLITREREAWYAIHLIVRKDQLHLAIREIRQIGGSGVVVTPVSYIFEEEPFEIAAMLAAVQS